MYQQNNRQIPNQNNRQEMQPQMQQPSNGNYQFQLRPQYNQTQQMNSNFNQVQNPMATSHQLPQKFNMDHFQLTNPISYGQDRVAYPQNQDPRQNQMAIQRQGMAVNQIQGSQGFPQHFIHPSAQQPQFQQQFVQNQLIAPQSQVAPQMVQRTQNEHPNTKTFQFVSDYMRDGSMPTTINDIKTIRWAPGTHSEQIQIEIRKVLGLYSDALDNTVLNMCINDKNDNPVILHEGIDFNQVYKVSLSTSIANTGMANGFQYQYGPMNNLYQPSQNNSLLYSPTTMGGSLFKSPNIGESHHQFNGHKNNWDQHPQTPGPQKVGIESRHAYAGQTPMYPPRKLEEGLMPHAGFNNNDQSLKSDNSNQNLAKYVQNTNNVSSSISQQAMQVMPSFGPAIRQSMNPSTEKMLASGQSMTSAQFNIQLANQHNLKAQQLATDNIDEECDLEDSFVQGDGTGNQYSSHNQQSQHQQNNSNQSIIQQTMNKVNNLQPFVVRKQQNMRIPINFAQGNMYQEQQIQSARVPSSGREIPMTGHGYQEQMPLSSRGQMTKNQQIPQSKEGLDPSYFENLYAQINQNNKNIQQRQENQEMLYKTQPKQMNQNEQQTFNQNFEINRNEISEQSASDYKASASNNPKKVHDNTLCGLSNINKESDSEKFEDNFEKQSPMTNNNNGQQQNTIYKKKIEEEQQNKNKIPYDLVQEIAKQTQIFDQQKQKKELQSTNQKHRETSGNSRGKQAKVVSSKGVKNNLLQHLKDEGFKVGLTNIDKLVPQEKQGNNEVNKQSNPLNSREPPQQVQNDQKYNSPETDANSKRQPARSISNSTPNEKPAFSGQQQNQFDSNQVILPAYGEGKFYQNNEAEILKQKIEKLERERIQKHNNDLQKIVDERKKEEEKAKKSRDKLVNLSPYSGSRALPQDGVGNVQLTNIVKGSRTPEQAEMDNVQSLLNKLRISEYSEANNSSRKGSQTPLNPQNVNSPLGMAMKQIGLQIGVNTGFNLNNMLVQKKPSNEAQAEGKESQPSASKRDSSNSKSADRVLESKESQPQRQLEMKKANKMNLNTPALEKEAGNLAFEANGTQLDNLSEYQPLSTPKNNLEQSSKKAKPVKKFSNQGTASFVPLSPNACPTTPIMTRKTREEDGSRMIIKKKEADESADDKSSISGFTDNTNNQIYNKPISSNANPTTPVMSNFRTPNAPPRQLQKFNDRKKQEGDDSGNFDDSSSIPEVPQMQKREQEKSVSDISQIDLPQFLDKTPPPKGRQLALRQQQRNQWAESKSAESDSQFSKQQSVRRQQEMSKSDISQIERSPFLQLKKAEPLGQIAGTPFEFVQPAKTDPRIQRASREIQYNGSFQLQKGSIISEQSIKNDYDDDNNNDDEVDDLKLGEMRGLSEGQDFNLFASQKHSSQDKLNYNYNIEQALNQEEKNSTQKLASEGKIDVSESQKKSEEISRQKASSFRKQKSNSRGKQQESSDE